MKCIGRPLRSRTAAALLNGVCIALILSAGASWAQEQVSLRFQGAAGRGVSVTRIDIALVDKLFSFQGDEIVSAAGDFAAAGFAAGMVVSIDGSSANDGLYSVAAVAGGRLILDPADHLSSENLSGTPVTIAAAWVPAVQVPALLPLDAREAVRATAALDVPVSGASAAGIRVESTLSDLLFLDGGMLTQDVVRTLGGDFRDVGFAVGTVFAVRGSSANDGLYDVTDVREEIRGSGQFNELVLSVAAALTSEGTAGVPTTATLLTAAPGFTAEAWVRFAEHAAGEFPAKWEAVMGKGRAWAISRYSNTDRVTFSTWTGSEYHDVVSASDLAPGLWHHVAAVYDGSTKSLYVDGGLVASTAWSGPLLCDESPLMLGNAPVVAGDARLKEGRGLDGWLDVCRLWSLPRSQAEVVATMQRRLRGSETGLLGAWRFDETANRTAVVALDSSAQGNHGAIEDLDPEASRIHGYDTAFEPPISLAIVLGSALTGNYALQLNGIDQFVMVQNEVIFDFVDGFALELWVDLDHLPTAGTAALISKGADAYELGVTTGGLPTFTVAGLPATVSGLTALAPGDWHHLAAIAEKSADTGLWDLIVMLDGAIDNAAYGLAGTPTVNDLPLCFGARPTLGPGSEAYFPGSIDDVRAWVVALPPERIAQSLTRALTGREPGLAGWWPLDEGDGVVVADMKTVMTDPDSLVTLQFEQLAFPGNEIKRYPSVYRENSPDPLLDPEGARDDAFVVSNSSVAPDCFAVKGEAMPDYPGSTALYNTIPLANTLLTMDANKPFRVLSIDLGDLHQDASPGTQVTFQTTIAGTVVERTFSLDGGDTTPETFTFQRFNAVTELRWKQMPGYHLFDNIVLQDLDSLAPWHLKADGLLIDLADWARIDSPLLFTDPVDAQYALRFDGSGDWVEVPLPLGTPTDYFAMQVTGATPAPFALEVWIRPHTVFVGTAPDNTNPFETIMRQGDVGWGLAVDAAGFLRYWIADDPASSLASDRPLQFGVWQHVALVVDPVTNTIAFYINGAPAGDHEAAIISLDTVNTGLAIGTDSTVSPAAWLHADLDEIRIWDQARDADEVLSFANRSLPNGMSGLLAYWRLNDGLGASAEDSSGNGMTAVLRDGAAAFDYPEWIYGPAPPNRDGMWALQFDGIDDYLSAPHSPGLVPTSGGVTLEAWVYPVAKGSAFTDSNELYRTILMKGEGGYGLALSRLNELVFWPGATSKSISDARLVDGEWQHVAVTCPSNGGPVTFYINGEAVGHSPASANIGSIDVADGESLFVGRQGLGSDVSPARNHFKGNLDEIRIWDGVRPADEIAHLATRQLFSWGDPELLAYWNFNHFDPVLLLQYDPNVNFLEVPDDASGGIPLTFGEDVMDVSAYIPGLYNLYWDGDFWDVGGSGSGNFSRDMRTQGLWVGTVVLNAVNEVQTAKPGESGIITPTYDTLNFTIILHVSGGGKVHLLKDVTIMQHPDGEQDQAVPAAGVSPGTETGLVLVTDDTLIPEFEGVQDPTGSRIGQRLSTIAYDFEGSELRMEGGLGSGRALRGTLVLPRLHPSNPFRHKYHPDHRNINPDNAAYGYEIQRAMSITFDETDDGAPTSGGYGVSRLTGDYEETIQGLHKVPLIVRGRLDIRRISTVGVLNQ